MFTKTLLSLVSLLFVGSQIVNAAAVTAPVVDNCSTTPRDCSSEADKAADGFCYDSTDKKLYVINKANNCYKVAGVQLNTGVNIMKIDTSAISEDSSSLSGDISSNIAKYAIYNCNSSRCVRAYGYIKDFAKYYEIRHDGTNVETEKAAACASNIGMILTTDSKLCVNGEDGETVDWSSGNSVFSGLKTENPFTATPANFINVKRESNYMIEDKLTTGCSISVSENGQTCTVTDCATNDFGYYAVFRASGCTANTGVFDSVNDPACEADSYKGILVKVTGNNACSVATASDVGYFKSTFNDVDYYISRNYEATAVVTVLEQKSACSDSGAEVNENGEICMGAQNTNAIPFGGDKLYYLTNSEAIYGATTTDKFIVKAEADTIKDVTADLTATKKYLVHDVTSITTVIKAMDYDSKTVDSSFNGNDYCVLNDMQIMARKTGLCQPDSLGECTYYNCNGSSCEISETNEECKACNPVSDDGTTGKSGTLFGTDADDAQLCIIPDETSPVTALVSTDAKYMVPYKATLMGIGALNGNDYFIAMEITGKNVKVLKENVRYRYTDTDNTNRKSSYKVFSRTEAYATTSTSGGICNASGKPFEYMLVQWSPSGETLNDKVDYYIVGDNSDLPAE